MEVFIYKQKNEIFMYKYALAQQVNVFKLEIMALMDMQVTIFFYQ